MDRTPKPMRIILSHGYGIQAKVVIPNGTRVLMFSGILRDRSFKFDDSKKTHLCSIEDTNLTLDGRVEYLPVSVNCYKNFDYGAPVASLVNCAATRQEANLRKVTIEEPFIDCNGIACPRSSYLEATRDIQPGEELLWWYAVY